MDSGTSAPEFQLSKPVLRDRLGLGNLVKTRGKPRSREKNADEDGLEQRSVNGRVGVTRCSGNNDLGDLLRAVSKQDRDNDSTPIRTAAIVQMRPTWLSIREPLSFYALTACT